MSLSRQLTVRLGPCGAWSMLRRRVTQACAHDVQRESLYGRFASQLSKVALQEFSRQGARIHALRLRIVDAETGRVGPLPPYLVRLEWIIESEIPRIWRET